MGNSRGILAERFPDLLPDYKQEGPAIKELDSGQGKAWTLP
jgi:hypothetical protein